MYRTAYGTALIGQQLGTLQAQSHMSQSTALQVTCGRQMSVCQCHCLLTSPLLHLCRSQLPVSAAAAHILPPPKPHATCNTASNTTGPSQRDILPLTHPTWSITP
jgi:hypothetical protein